MSTPDKLTSEQQELITDYLKNDSGWSRLKVCIEKTLKRKPSKDEMDEWLSISMLGLVKAAKRYDASRNIDFSSYVYLSVSSTVKTQLTRQNRQCRGGYKMTISFDQETAEGLNIADGIASAIGVEIQEYDRINQYLSTKPEEAKRMLSLLMSGYKLSEIKRLLNCTAKRANDLLEILRQDTEILDREVCKNEKNWCM